MRITYLPPGRLLQAANSNIRQDKCQITKRLLELLGKAQGNRLILDGRKAYRRGLICIDMLRIDLNACHFHVTSAQRLFETRHSLYDNFCCLNVRKYVPAMEGRITRSYILSGQMRRLTLCRLPGCSILLLQQCPEYCVHEDLKVRLEESPGQ